MKVLFDFIPKYLPWILEGFIVTVQITFVSIFMGLILGTILAIGDLYGGKIVSTIIRVYVEFFRGSALIAQAFVFFFAVFLGPLQMNLIDPIAVGFVVFSLNSAAYQKGYIKGAMEAVYKNQMEAALSVGLSKAQTIRFIVLPQAMRIMIPGWSNEFSSLAKSTPALLVMGVRDLTAVGKTMSSQTFRFIETYAFIGALYLIWISIMLKIIDIIYERVKIPEIEISG